MDFLVGGSGVGCFWNFDPGLQSVKLLWTQLVDRTPPNNRFGDVPWSKWDKRDDPKRPIIGKSDEFQLAGFLIPQLHESLRFHPHGGLGRASSQECCKCDSNYSSVEII